jgi:hypothetical protein
MQVFDMLELKKLGMFFNHSIYQVVTSDRVSATPRVPEPSILTGLEAMPPELIRLGFAYLPSKDLLAISYVSRSMKERVVEIINENVPVAIKRFIEDLIRYFDEQGLSAHRASLEKLGYPEVLNNRFANVTSAKLHFFRLREQVVDALKLVDREHLLNLRKAVDVPEFLGSIFRLVDIGLQVDIANRSQTSERKTFILRDCIERFTSLEEFTIAIKVAQKIPLLKCKQEALQEIISVLEKEEYINQPGSLSLLCSLIKDIADKERLVTDEASLVRVITVLIEPENIKIPKNIDRAIQVCKQIKNRQKRVELLLKIMEALILPENIDRPGNLKKALEVADLERKDRMLHFLRITEILIQLQKIDQLENLNLVMRHFECIDFNISTEERTFVFEKIATALIQSKTRGQSLDVDGLIQTASSVESKEYRGFLLHHIARVFAKLVDSHQVGNMNQVMKLIEAISDEYLRFGSLLVLAPILVRSEICDETIQQVRAIPAHNNFDRRRIENGLRTIFDALVKLENINFPGNLDRALKLGKETKNVKAVLWAFIFSGNMNQERVDRAVQIAREFPLKSDEYSESLQWIVWALINPENIDLTGNIDRARQIVQDIVCDGTRGRVFEKMAKVLIQRDDTNRVFLMVQHIFQNPKRIGDLLYIIEAFIGEDNGKLFEALLIARKISDPEWKDKALEKIVLKVSWWSSGDRIKIMMDLVVIAQEMNHQKMKERSIQHVIEAIFWYAERNLDHQLEILVTRAIQIIEENLLNKEIQDGAFEYIIKTLIRPDRINQPGNVERAVQVVEKMSHGKRKQENLKKIITTLIEPENIDHPGNIDRARQIISHLPDFFLQGVDDLGRSEANLIVIRALIQFKSDLPKIDRSIEIMQEICDPRIRESAVGWIAQALIESGNIDRAIQIAQLISKQTLRTKFLISVINMFSRQNSIHSPVNREIVIQIVQALPDPYHQQVVLEQIQAAISIREGQAKV